MYSVTLNNMNSVPLKGATSISLRAGQTIRIEQSQPSLRHERFRVVPMAYTYGFTIAGERGEQELLTFHWNRLATPLGMLPRGHLHIGPGLFVAPTSVRPGDFHRAHVPTGELSFEAVVRFAIAELGVTSLVDDSATILSRAEDAVRH